MADGGDQGTSGTSSSSSPATIPTKASVIKRIEHLFSRENLTSDVTLQYQMNYDCYVPISAVISHPKIKELTSDAELVTEAIKSTSIVALDETKNYVKPAYKIPRVTIILREIPSSTPSEEIEKIFEGEESAKPIKVKSEVGDNWYVTFASEDEMMKAFLSTRSRKFNGEPVKARIKSEILAKSFYYPAAVVTDPQAMTAPQYGYQGQYYYSHGGQPSGGRGRGGANVPGSNAPPGGPGAHSTNGPRYNNNGAGGGPRGGARTPSKKGDYRKPNYNPESQPSAGGESVYTHPPRNPAQRPPYSKEHPYSRENVPMNENNKDGPHHPRGPPKEGTQPTTDPSKKRTTAARRRTGSETKQPGNHGGAFQLGTSHFPPLPSKDGNNSHSSGVSTSGYSREFRKHTHSAIIETIKGLPEAATAKPNGLPTSEECPAILQKPRQIDEVANSRTPTSNEVAVQSESQTSESNKAESSSTATSPAVAVSPSPSASSASASSASASSASASSSSSTSAVTTSTTISASSTSTTTNSPSPSPPSPSTSSSSSNSLWSQIVGNKPTDGKK
eukprot:TRINITY_DN5831_c0_g1_i1.p1 TRINITY_DN5831_c0_g1~~TRINITY_DN5831_c0_g1_i1.p1  ORF type:complete len:560 (-),score=123.96 TRINITY_DN5831_c0_g1_i1:164-1843(-)